MTVDWFRNFLEHADFWPSPIICFTARIATVATRAVMIKAQHSDDTQVAVALLSKGLVSQTSKSEEQKEAKQSEGGPQWKGQPNVFEQCHHNSNSTGHKQ